MSAPSTIHVTRYLTVILRWLLITFVVFVLTLFSGVYITDNLLHKVYTATAQVQGRPSTFIGGSFVGDHFGQAEVETLDSPEVLLPIIKDLGLDKTWAKQVYEADSDQLPDVDALTHMRNILKLDLQRRTNIIDITASSDDPKEAADIANAIADRYKTMRDLEEDQRNNQGGEALRDQIAQQQQVVDKANAALGKIGDHQSPAYQAAQHDLEKQLELLDADTVRIKQAIEGGTLTESPVRIISRAEVPTVPTHPNKHFDFIVTIVGACFLSLTTASFVEIIFLFLRASERTDN